MKKKLLLIFFIVLFSSCAIDAELNKTKGYKSENLQLKFEPIEGVLRIKIDETMSSKIESQIQVTNKLVITGDSSFDSVLHKINTYSIQRTFPHSGKFEERTRKEGLHLWYDIYFDKTINMEKASEQIKNVPGVLKREYRPEVKSSHGKISYIFPFSAAASEMNNSKYYFNDPMLPSQWHYKNIGKNHDSEKIDDITIGCDINVAPVWENFTTGSSDVIVAVVDGGVDIVHEDLVGNIWINEQEKNGIKGVDDDNNGYIDDIHGYNFYRGNAELDADAHGTHVAGVIGAVNNNSIGVSGIAGGDAQKGVKGARIMSCQILYNGASKDKIHQAAAIKYGADNGAVISQNSWSYGPNGQLFESDKAAIDYFIKYAGIDENNQQVGPMRGGVVIFAAGNDDIETGYPGQYSECISVASLGADYVKAYYSTYGEWVSIAAPGGDAKKKSEIISTIPGGYAGMQGTSMACPHISGVAALIVSYYGKEGFTSDDLEDMLLSSTIDIEGINSGYESKLGVGFIDALKAFDKDYASRPSTINNLRLSAKANFISLYHTMPVSQGARINKLNYYYSKDKFDSNFDRIDLPEDMYSFTINALSISQGQQLAIAVPNNAYLSNIPQEKAKNQTASEILFYPHYNSYDFVFPHQDIEFEEDYYFAVESENICGDKSELSNILKVRTEKNTPPKVMFNSSDTIYVQKPISKYFDILCEDEDGHTMSATLKDTNMSMKVWGENVIDKFSIEVISAELPVGVYTNTLVISDENYSEVSIDFVVKVTEK